MEDKKELNNQFLLACKQGDLNLVKLFLNFNADIHHFNDIGFRKACANGHYEVVRYLATSPELTEHSNIHAYNDMAFNLACAHGHVDVIGFLLSENLKEQNPEAVKNLINTGIAKACEAGCLKTIQYMFSMPVIKEFINTDQSENFIEVCRAAYIKGNYIEILDYLINEKSVDINLKNDAGFRKACEFGKIEVVEYLLFAPQLSKHANIGANNNESIYFASRGGYLDVLKLLTSPKLINQVNIHDMNDRAFKVAVENKQNEVINYFLYDLNHKFSAPYMNEIKKENPDLFSAISKRDLFFKIQNQFDKRTENIKTKMKI